jgi:transcription-repair coupling factor (superfamily II helicase)
VTEPAALGPLLGRGDEVWGEALGAPRLVVASAGQPYVVSLLAERAAPLLVVTPRSSDAQSLADGLAAHLGADRVATFPAWETLPDERLSPQPATVGRRAAVLDRLVHPDSHSVPLAVVVAPVRAALQPMDPRLTERRPLVLAPGAREFDGLVRDLAALGYERVPRVESRGEFAVRGGIVDLFPTAGEHAVRVEFFGDVIEGMRTFAVADQRALGPVDRVVVDVARELVLDEDLAVRARAAIARAPEHVEALSALAEGRVVEGAESLAIALAERPAILADLMPAGTGLVLVEAGRCRDRAGALAEEVAVLSAVAWHVPRADGATVGFAAHEELRARLGGPVWELEPFGGPTEERLAVEPWDSFRGDVPALAGVVKRLLVEGTRVVISVDADGPARRIVDVLADEDVPAITAEVVSEASPGGRVEVVVSPLRAGFRAAELGLALLGTSDVFGPRRRRAARRMAGARATAGDAVLELTDGDAVVHRVHGVGRYRGMVTRELPGLDGRRARRDYVVVEYAGGDTLFVPSDQVDALARYQGGESPTVMRMGGAQWERAKAKVRSAARDIAADLIRLYAARLHSPGNAAAPDGAMQSELEDAFAHVETADQLAVIDEIKRDMETPLPMDRLLAGDVGFGKTEVAVRAAGKAVFDGRQVAVLVPTTILAQQHAETFRERFSGFPVRIGVLSRFTPERERRQVLDGLAAGTVDLVIGTHALIGRSVSFKDLGLVIIDEEHRFGVAHKEALKRLRTSVDVLSMSATPIPRTLEMAVSGIRDLSVIETPPEDRQPIITSVMEHDDVQVALAIRRELLRDGQVFYVHNQVETIGDTVVALKELVPDARFGIAHGQMDERELERAMLDFWERETDVLVCSTIIESGLDVPNANTLIVERADLLGLAQLHQLRGRVGRSSERGYAYFTHPPDVALSELAQQRLATIAERSRLGSGLAIAMRDLELRGAGNVIGADQSGHVAAVGLETYSELLREEVADLTGRPTPTTVDVRLDLPVDAHLPDDYVADANDRLDLYRRIAAVRDARGIRDVEAELADRFGPPPPPVTRLLALAALKAALHRWGVTEVALTGRERDRLRVAPVLLDPDAREALERALPGSTLRADSGTLTVPLPRRRPDDLIAWVAATLRTVFGAPSA